MSPQQTTPTAMEVAVIAQQTGVDTLLRKLPTDVAAAVAANRSPLDQLRAISAALQSELDMRYKTVRRKMSRVLESHARCGLENALPRATRQPTWPHYSPVTPPRAKHRHNRHNMMPTKNIQLDV